MAQAGTTINVSGGNVAALIQAINDANSEVAPFNGPDTIVLDGSTFTLTAVNNTTYGPNGLPAVSSEITIEGNGSTIQRANGAPNFRILAVNATGNLTLQETTISGGIASGSGNRGGGIFNEGTLTLNDSTVSGNSSFESAGGGVLNDRYGTLTITNSTISGNWAWIVAGGVASCFNGGVSTLTITNSTISGNSAGWGGGVCIGSISSNSSLQTIITNSTISSNSARYSGGGVYTRDFGAIAEVTITNSTISGNSAGTFGGGVYTHGIEGEFSTPQTRTLTITNSTISGNSAAQGGGVFNRAVGATSTLTITNSTISGNSAFLSGGGVYNKGGPIVSAELMLTRSLLSGNTAALGAEAVNRNAYSTIAANNYNLLGHSGLTNAQAFYNFTPGATDIAATSNGTTPTALNAILNPILADNGGPTQTHTLVPGSPAIDASPADADCQPTNQRGVLRPQGPACDIGAFELAVEDCDNSLDDDGDGLIDQLDPDCPSSLLSIQKGTLNPTAAGKKIVLQATFAGVANSINPPTEGVTLNFLDGDGLITQLTFPPGAKWQTSTGPKWTFKNPTSGKTLTLKFDAQTGTFVLTAKVKSITLNDPDAGTIATSVVIGEDAFLNTQPWRLNNKGKIVTP